MSDTQSQDVPTLSVDGINYPIVGLPDDIRELIAVYQGWESTLGTQKIEVFKTEAAMRAVSSEIQTRIRNMAAAAEAEKAKTAETSASNDESA